MERAVYCCVKIYFSEPKQPNQSIFRRTFRIPWWTLNIELGTGHSLQNSKAPLLPLSPYLSSTHWKIFSWISAFDCKTPTSLLGSLILHHLQGANMTLYDEFDQFQCLPCAEGKILIRKWNVALEVHLVQIQAWLLFLALQASFGVFGPAWLLALHFQHSVCTSTQTNICGLCSNIQDVFFLSLQRSSK